MQLLAISGSLRRGSYNSALLRAAGAALPSWIEYRSLQGLGRLPAYNEDLEPAPLTVVVFRRALAQADAVLFATPEYNSSVPGVLKNALDWASRPFETNPLREKPVAVIGASQGAFGAIWAQAELRKVLMTIGARVDERELVVPHVQHAFTAEGTLRDPGVDAALREIIKQLLETTRHRAA
jgi:chromate reductase